MSPEWVGTREACERLGVTLRSLYRLVDSGALPAYRFGRVIRLRVEDVEQFGRGSDGGEAGAVVRSGPRPPALPGMMARGLPVPGAGVPDAAG